jgi:hypothetical protein
VCVYICIMFTLTHTHTHTQVHELNENPKLPFADGSFDAVVCASAIQYYTQPEAVLAGVCVCVCVCVRACVRACVRGRVYPVLHTQTYIQRLRGCG